MKSVTACDACLARTWLLARLAGHLDLHRDRIDSLLELDDDELIAALAGAPAADDRARARVLRCRRRAPAGAPAPG